jgi:hypothetical protein
LSGAEDGGLYFCSQDSDNNAHLLSKDDVSKYFFDKAENVRLALVFLSCCFAGNFQSVSHNTRRLVSMSGFAPTTAETVHWFAVYFYGKLLESDVDASVAFEHAKQKTLQHSTMHDKPSLRSLVDKAVIGGNKTGNALISTTAATSTEQTVGDLSPAECEALAISIGGDGQLLRRSFVFCCHAFKVNHLKTRATITLENLSHCFAVAASN